MNSTNGVVQGAGYTDVHARMPAMTILIFLSLASALILLANVRSRGWSLPAVAVGLWAFVALIIGVLYPTFLQTLQGEPRPGARSRRPTSAQHRRDAPGVRPRPTSSTTRSRRRTTVPALGLKADAARSTTSDSGTRTPTSRWRP